MHTVGHHSYLEGMVAFEIQINGRRHCVAGLENGVVSAFVIHANLPPDPPEKRPPKMTPPTSLSVTGITAEHQSVHWQEIADGVHVGDVITIRVIDTDSPDRPTATPILPDVSADAGL